MRDNHPNLPTQNDAPINNEFVCNIVENQFDGNGSKIICKI